MFSCSLKGRLGNMLFQIATTYALGLRNNIEVVFDLNSNGASKYIKNILRNIPNSQEVPSLQIYKEHSSDYQPMRLTNNTRLEGYFQSHKYFEDYKSNILKIFEASEELKFYIHKKYSFLSDNNNIGIHVRRGDYLGRGPYPTHPSLVVQDIEYYERGIEIIGEEQRLVVCSDDIPWCKRNFRSHNIEFIEGEQDYIDLYILSYCSNNIIANSSFSWWAAYMNRNKGTVIAPKRWYKPEARKSTKDRYYPNWLII